MIGKVLVALFEYAPRLRGLWTRMMIINIGSRWERDA
jgi:hypothetical protein